ncbi:MAG: MBL fold metallo-hydrolase [candidate division NC10 bacterium]|nr:MBL fold metallo-hydrolase [candidate division NC10 bacterium]
MPEGTGEGKGKRVKERNGFAFSPQERDRLGWGGVSLSQEYRGPASVITIDCHFLQPGRASAYLIREKDRAAFVDNNRSEAVPHLLRALKEHGLQPEQVEYAILTHIHLDHAGGTSALLEACPEAMVLAHPRAACHLIDPSRLLASAEKIYGKELLEAVYGTIKPIPADRVRAVEDGERLTFGQRTLTFLHTPGHARHHLCIYDSESNGIFTGDTFGVSYGPLRQGGPPCLLPSSPPTDFNPEQARRSVQKILQTGAERAFLGHFGEYAPLREGADQMFQGLDLLKEILKEIPTAGRPGEDLLAFAEGRVRTAIEQLLARGCRLSLAEEDWMALEPEIRLSAQGLLHAAQRIYPA